MKEAGSGGEYANRGLGDTLLAIRHEQYISVRTHDNQKQLASAILKMVAS
jgi:hypothetical protein